MTCPRCLRPSLFPDRLIFNLADSVEQLRALDCPKIRTESSLYSNVSRGTGPAVLTRGRKGIRIRHCDLAAFVQPFTEKEFVHITVYDQVRTVSHEQELIASVRLLLEDLERATDVAAEVHEDLDDAEYDLDADIDRLAETMTILEAEFHRLAREVRTAKRKSKAIIDEKAMESLNGFLSNGERDRIARLQVRP